MAPFDVKLEHLMTNYFTAIGDQHDICQTFIQNDILTFDWFINMSTLEILKNMKLKKGNAIVDAFTDGKIKLVNDILLYYTFLYQDDKDALAEDPTQSDKRNFKKLKSRGYPLSTNTYNTSKAGSNTNVTLNTTNTAATSKTKSQNDAWLSWRQSIQDETAYPLLEADQMYTDWI